MIENKPAPFILASSFAFQGEPAGYLPAPAI